MDNVDFYKLDPQSAAHMNATVSEHDWVLLHIALDNALESILSTYGHSPALTMNQVSHLFEVHKLASLFLPAECESLTVCPLHRYNVTWRCYIYDQPREW